MSKEPTNIEVMNAVNLLRELVDKDSASTGEKQIEIKKMSGENQVKIKKLNDFITKQDKKDQEVTLKLLDLEKREVEKEEKIKELEQALLKSGQSNRKGEVKTLMTNFKEQKELLLKGFDIDRLNEKADPFEAKKYKQSCYEEVNSIVKDLFSGTGYVNPAEYKTMMVGDNTQGGYMVNPVISSEILRKIVEISPIRSIASVQTVQTIAPLPIITEKGGAEAFWVGEIEDRKETGTTYEEGSIPLHGVGSFVPVSKLLLNLPHFNIEADIKRLVPEAIAKTEGKAFVNGNGVKKPLGLFTASGVSEQKSGDASLITADSLIQLAGKVNSNYNRTYLLNENTLTAIRLLKTSQGEYLWQRSYSEGTPPTINGFKYVIAQDVDDIGVGTTPVMIGDFPRAYKIVDYRGLEIVKDPFNLLIKGIVRIFFETYTGGQVVLPEAIAKLKIEA